MEYFSSLNIDVPWAYDFLMPGFSRNTPRQIISMGETNDQAQAKVNPACGDQRDTIIKEYVTYRAGFKPLSPQFTQTGHSQHFTFAELNTGDYSWAILMSNLLIQIENVRSYNGSTPLNVSNAYRNPAKQNRVNPKAPNSRHVFGDAVDFASSDVNTWVCGLYS